MDFSNLNQSFNNMLGGAEGGGPAVWILALVVVLAAVGVYMYLNEYFSCSTGRVSVDGKCVDMCPEGYKFKSLDEKTKGNAICTNAKGEDGTVAIPTPKPTPAATSSSPK